MLVYSALLLMSLFISNVICSLDTFKLFQSSFESLMKLANRGKPVFFSEATCVATEFTLALG